MTYPRILAALSRGARRPAHARAALRRHLWRRRRLLRPRSSATGAGCSPRRSSATLWHGSAMSCSSITGRRPSGIRLVAGQRFSHARPVPEPGGSADELRSAGVGRQK